MEHPRLDAPQGLPQRGELGVAGVPLARPNAVFILLANRLKGGPAFIGFDGRFYFVKRGGCSRQPASPDRCDDSGK